MGNKKCCEQMQEILDIKPKDGLSYFESGNTVLYYNEKFDEYGLIIHDGGESYIGLDYCPWCGKKLPISKRDDWFDELEKIGITDPYEEEIPEEYKTSQWWDK